MSIRQRVARWWPELVVVIAAGVVLARVPVLSAAAAVVLILWAPGAMAARWLHGGLLPSRRRARSETGPSDEGRTGPGDEGKIGPSSKGENGTNGEHAGYNLASGAALALSIALSLALSPVIIYWTSLLAGFNRTPLTLALAAAALLFSLVTPSRAHPLPPSRSLQGRILETPRYRALLAALLLALAALLALPYLHVWRNGLLLEPSVGDWAKHYSVAWLVERSGIPPRNLLYPPWQEQPFAYYYFFHSVVAALHLLGGSLLSLVNAFVLTLVAAALALVSLAVLFARGLFGAERPALLAALFLSLAGGSEGLLLLPQMAANVAAGGISATALFGLQAIGDCRASRIVDFYSIFLWAPQHTAAGLIFVLGLLLLQALGHSRRLALLAPLLLFALAGYSVYVAIPVVVALAGYAALDIYYQARQAPATQRAGSALRRAGPWLAIAAASLALAWPYLRDLWATRGAETSGLALTVTRNGVGWLDGAVFSQLLGDSPLTRLLDAPTHYLSQIGALVLLGLAGWAIYLRQRRGSRAGHSPAYLLLLLAALAGLVLTQFLASRGALLGLQGAPLWLGCNDFRSRGVLPLQIALAIFAGLGLATVFAWLWSRARAGRWRRLVALLALLLVILSTAGMLRYAAGRTLGRFVSPQGVTAEAMQVYQFLRRETPPDALFQGGPGRDFALRRYADRISRVETSVHTLIPAPMAAKLADQRALQQAFGAASSEEAWTLLHSLGVDYLVVGPEERSYFAAASTLDQFADPRYFRPVYASPTHQVYRVLVEPDAAQRTDD